MAHLDDGLVSLELGGKITLRGATAVFGEERTGREFVIVVLKDGRKQATCWVVVGSAGRGLGGIVTSGDGSRS